MSAQRDAFVAEVATAVTLVDDDHERETKSSIMIDQLGSESRLKVREPIRAGVHRVRRLRDDWAQDTDEDPEPMPIERGRGLLQSYLDKFPNPWG